MLAAKNFQSGLMMVRQLEFSLFDFELHATRRRPQRAQCSKACATRCR
jgi:Zn-dependent oligopeptidase